MRSPLSRWLFTALIASGMLASATVMAQPDVRDHRKGGGRGVIGIKIGVDVKVNANAEPRDAPPPPRAEKFNQRSGFVWVAGQWEWKGGQWVWSAGHYEKFRRGKKWRERRWEKRGDVYAAV